MSDEWQRLADALDELGQAIKRETILKWGIRGLIIRLVAVIIVLELVFVVLPWAWRRFASWRSFGAVISSAPLETRASGSTEK